MEKKLVNNIRLGIFVIAGLLVLVVSLYLIGQNQNFFGSNFLLKARFHNINGLMPGNNVRFSGIQCGTVKDIRIINDTTIEVGMLISQKTSPYIRANARAAIGSEGLMGNKVINILPGSADAPAISDGGMLRTDAGKGFDDIMGTLSATGDNVLEISSSLKETTRRINASPALSGLLADSGLTRDLDQSLENFRQAAQDIRAASATVNHIVSNVQRGKGAAGILLSDSQAAIHVAQSLEHIHSISLRADKLVADVDSLARDLHTDVQIGPGPVHTLLKDSVAASNIKEGLQNINNGAAIFNEDMKALQHNFLLKKYFKKQRKKKNAAP